MDELPIPFPEIPLFPLRTVLLPGGLLPLRIFEVRYLDMIGRCHKAGKPFGVVCLTEGSEVRKRRTETNDAAAPPDSFEREAFYPVGTLSSIDVLERTQPGLLTIRCIGTQRFRLQSTVLLPHGLWTGRAELMADDPEVAIPDDLARFALALRRLVQRLKGGAANPADSPLPPPHRWDDCGWVANRWCELLPLPLDDRQRLMALDNPLLRLELVADMLDRFDLDALELGKR